MAKQCEFCGRGSSRDAKRSHSNIKTLQRQYINLQTKIIDGKRRRICTRCLKTMVKLKKS